jgi:hypothetical protein
MTRFLDQTRERFLLAIAAQLPAERFMELHFFQPIRQSGIESGVAVIAAYPELQPEIIVADAPPVEEQSVIPSDDTQHVIPSDDTQNDIPSDDTQHVIPSEARDLLFPDTHEEQHRLTREPGSRSAPQDDKKRYTVYSARYKLILKGPDRGKWECAVVAEADAPLVTVESVVRGVQRRSGDSEEPERMTGDEARDYVLAASRGTAA